MKMVSIDVGWTRLAGDDKEEAKREEPQQELISEGRTMPLQ